MTILTVNVSVVQPSVSPALSSASAARNGSSAFSGSVTTNKGGTLYVLASTNASETQAFILANGTSQAVAAGGAVNFSGSGLTGNTTYYVHLAFTDGAETVTAVTNAFTTDAQGAGTGTVTVTLQRATSPAVAPYGVHYTINVSGAPVSEPANDADFDPTAQGLAYVTDWDDAGAASDVVVNVPSQWNDLNKAYGKDPAHVYTAPGTYTPTFRVYELDGTFVGEATATVTVADPDTTFTGNRTILVDPDDVGDTITYPSSQVVTSFAAAISAAQALDPTTARILFKRGETFNVTSTFTPITTMPNVYFGAWGTGNKPVINLPMSNSITAGGASAPGTLINLTDSFDFTFLATGIRFQGPWDSAAETGGHYRCISTTQKGNDRRVLIDDCAFDGWSWNIGATQFQAQDNYGQWVNNTDITNWGDYGLWVSHNENQFISATGCAIHQKETALMNGEGKDWTKNQHGPIRFQSGGRSYYAVLDLFTRNGWTTNTGWGDSDYGKQPTTQPCMRIGTTGDAPTKQPHIIVERVAMEGGYSIVQVKNENDTAGSTLSAFNVLFDKVLMVATACTWQAFEVQYTGWTARNVMVVIPDVPTRNFRWLGVFNDYDLSQGREKDPVEIYNLTVVNLKTADRLDGAGTAFVGDIQGTALTNDFTAENNAVYQVSGTPTEAIDVDLSAALATVGGTWTSRFLGLRWSAYDDVAAKLTMDTSWASPAGFVTTAVPGASSPLVGDATAGLVAYDDFYGVVRGASRDRGAVAR